MWWEWVDLDGRDIRIGWIYNLTVGGFFFALVAGCYGILAGLATIAVLHMVALYFGFSLRSGTVASSQEV